MFRLDEGLKAYLHGAPVDFRLNINGQSVLVHHALALDPFAACVFVFSNRRRNQVKLLGWARLRKRSRRTATVARPASAIQADGGSGTGGPVTHNWAGLKKAEYTIS